jgi:hypothetical protein
MEVRVFKRVLSIEYLGDIKSMNSLQKFFINIFPKSWAENMLAGSRSWMMRCECGFEMSVWEAGGIRWKAAGNPRRYMRCSGCGQSSWHTVYRKTAEAER